MSDNKGAPPPDGEHIEELLSQLKGIFGQLSETEREESRQKITPPAASLPRVPTPIPKPDPAPPLSEPQPPVPDPVPPEMPSAPPMDVSDLPALEPWIPVETSEPAAPATPSAAGAAPVTDASEFIPNEITVPEGASLVPTAIFYPAGRINEAKIVAEKVERITPKFTKISVVVNVQALAVYDAKVDLKTTVMAQVNTLPIKAVFILVDKLLDDTKRKALVADLEPRGIYLQEIPSHQVEKKALYTDMLLGMVFFFDSQKPAPGEPTT